MLRQPSLLDDWSPTILDDEFHSQPWMPRVLKKDQWPPDYGGVYQWRFKKLRDLKEHPEKIVGMKEYYRVHRAEFIMHWMDTFNPRNKVSDGPKWMPFVLFTRQAEFIQFLEECERDQACGLVEKCRDVGATWLCVAYSVHKWLFEPGAAIGWGSRGQTQVDILGVDDTIFEKLRKTIRRLPKQFLPKGFKPALHLTRMRILNPENGASITGEIGDDIGRGGRKTIYFKDESAHYEHPELIEAALGDNTNVQIDISSVNGLGNVFERTRHASSSVDWMPGQTYSAGVTRVFVIDWRDHPAKTQEWYDQRRANWSARGLLHVFKQEVDRDYAGAIENTIIPYEWVMAAVDADIVLAHKWPKHDWSDGIWGAALDPADEGGDTNALAKRKGIKLRSVVEWDERDPGVSARRAIADCREHKGIKVQYDGIGIGSTVKSEFNRLVLDEKIITRNEIDLINWVAGAGVLEPYARINPDDDTSSFNIDFFQNLKAQAWWDLRLRFWRTFQAVKLGIYYPPEQLIIIDGKIPLLSKLCKELAQPTHGRSGSLKMMINKKPDGTKSPNLADAVVMCYFPVPADNTNYLGSYGLGTNATGVQGYRKAA